MGAIIPFLKYDASFDEKDIQAMSLALGDVCRSLGIRGDNKAAAEVIAARIIELATHGERSPSILRDRVLAEASSAIEQRA